MSEIAVASLDPRLQKQVEGARAALDRGEFEHAAEFCVIILKERPACLEVRKLERAALLKLAAARRGGLARMVRVVSVSPFLLSGSLRLKDEPRLALATAEKILRRDPQNVAALDLLGQAALALGWPQTAIFAGEAARDLAPERPHGWVFLSGAYLAGGRARDAVHAAQEALRLQPANPEAQNLLRNASVAVTLAEGNWEEDGDYRGKLHNAQNATQLDQPARPSPKPFSAPP